MVQRLPRISKGLAASRSSKMQQLDNLGDSRLLSTLKEDCVAQAQVLAILSEQPDQSETATQLDLARQAVARLAKAKMELEFALLSSVD